ncbi:hypothetical protein, partial [Xanthomonas euvesicatoria]
MKNQPKTGVMRRIAAAVDGWVRSFSPKDKDLYVDRQTESETGAEVTPKTVLQVDAAWSCVRL